MYKSLGVCPANTDQRRALALYYILAGATQRGHKYIDSSCNNSLSIKEDAALNAALLQHVARAAALFAAFCDALHSESQAQKI